MALYRGIELPGRPDLENVRKLDLLPMPAIQSMMRYGFAVDREWFEELTLRFEAEAKELERDICQYVPKAKLDEFTEKSTENEWTGSIYSLPMNVDSATQLSKLLFKVLGVGKGGDVDLKATSTGQISTGKKQLEQLKHGHPVIQKVLQYRERQKLISTYTRKLPSMAHRHTRVGCYCGLDHRVWEADETWRIHCSILTTRTSTGRMASKSPNLQNVPARSDNGKAVRMGFVPSPGTELVTVDFSQQEMRGAAHLSKDANLIRIFEQDLDPHEETARSMFEIPVGQKPDKMLHREPSKTVNFGICIAEGQLVLTDHGEVPIEEIRCCHKVWDGVEFVNHGGLICRGEKEVISYDGLTATPDHKVWVAGEDRPITLSKAMAQGSRLAVSSAEGHPVRVQNHYVQDLSEEFLPSGMGRLLSLWSRNRSFGRQHPRWEKPWVSSMRSEEVHRSTIKSALRKIHGYQATMQQSSLRQLAGLRWPGNTVPIQELGRLRRFHAERVASPNIRRRRHWEDRQRWTLRAWKPSSRNTIQEPQKHPAECIGLVQGTETHSNWNGRNASDRVRPGYHEGTCCKASLRGRSMERDPEKASQKTTKVYDILNAGPRRRFTVGGKLVSNCYGLTPVGLYDQIQVLFAAAGVPDYMDLNWCGGIIDAWFESYPGMNDYMERQRYRARRYGAVWTPFGRVRLVPEVQSCHAKVVNAGLRQAGNAPIQGLGADLIKIAITEIHDTIVLPMLREGVWCWPLMTVHDELLLEVERGWGESVRLECEDVMSRVMTDRGTGENLCVVPVRADGHVLSRWEKG